MKALLVLFNKEGRVIFEHPLEADNMAGMLPALYLELLNNLKIENQWRHADHFHILSVADSADRPNPVTEKSTLNFIANCKQYNLTPAETDVALELRTGMSNRDIASKIGCSVNTVNTHVKHIYDKLRVKNRLAAEKKLEAQMGVV